MQRRLLPIAILTGVLLFTALVGYLIPANSEGPPVRILLENKGGKVIFAHKEHIAIQDKDCASCHHTSRNGQTPPACSQCHVKTFDEVFKTTHQKQLPKDQCVSCHHPAATIEKFSHDAHAEEYAPDDCESCHHDASIEPEPQACSDCHKKESTEKMISLKEANHTRCAECHLDMYQEGLKGCQNCHARGTVPQKPEQQACSSCHDNPADQLIPTKTSAFHGKCMGCHENMDAGPFGDEACYQCHMK